MPKARASAALARSKTGDTEYLAGDYFETRRIEDIPVPTSPGDATFAVVPFRQATERGYGVIDDMASIRGFTVDPERAAPKQLDRVHLQKPYRLRSIQFDIDDLQYARLVERVIDEEIRAGSGSTFVIHRALLANVDTTRPGWRQLGAHEAFRNLLHSDPNSYWRFSVNFPDMSMIGSSPEPHIVMSNREVRMRPMSGTVALTGASVIDATKAFAADEKERAELLMVLDEELKMLCRLHPSSVRVKGPFAGIFGTVGHTFFEIVATVDSADPLGLLRSTLFAPTVTGSPLREAFNVIARVERSARGYYAGVVLLLECTETGLEIDSAIAIRTAYISSSGQLRLPVGASIVRDSDPLVEARETRNKAQGLLNALTGSRGAMATIDSAWSTDLALAIEPRRWPLASFWTERSVPSLRKEGSRSALMVDFDDDWTTALGYMLRSLDVTSQIVSWRELAAQRNPLQRLYDLSSESDFVILGPGPGDPADIDDPRIALARLLASKIDFARRRVFAVCLSHQCMCLRFGISVAQLEQPQQGAVRGVTVNGRLRRLAFYNSFAGFASTSAPIGGLRVWREPDGDEVFGLQLPGMVSVQFHLESISSVDGHAVAGELLDSLLS